MTRYQPKARALIESHLESVASVMRSAGHNTHEIQNVQESLLEHIDAMAAQLDDPTEPLDLEDTAILLGQLDPPEAYGMLPVSSRERLQSSESVDREPEALARLALGVSLLFVPLAVVLGSLPGAPEPAGGTVLIFGAFFSVVLGFFSRTSRSGQVALLIGGSVAVLLAAAFVIP